MAAELPKRILSDKNLEEARHKVMSSKGAAGADRMPVSRLPEYIFEHGEEMKELIRQRRHRPLPLRRVQIPKDDGTKRNPGVPAVKDRWIEQAVCQILTPYCQELFSENSFGFRPGRKAEQTVLKSLEYMNDGYDWIVDPDLTKCFGNVNQDILMILVHNVIRDPDAESLIRRFLQTGVLCDGTFEETKINCSTGLTNQPAACKQIPERVRQGIGIQGTAFYPICG